jgi:hypothetical protein
MIEGRASRKTSNALTLTFRGGPQGEQIAVARQGEDDKTRAKVGILFGFKNGGSGRHVITFTDGRKLHVHSRRWRWATILTDDDGRELGTIDRGNTSRALDATGRELLHFAPVGDNGAAADRFKMVVTSPDGALVGYLDIIRQVSGWSASRLLETLLDEYLWFDQAGQALPIPFLGSRVTLMREVTDQERDALHAACVDVVIGLCVYFTDMGLVPRDGWPPDPDRPGSMPS